MTLAEASASPLAPTPVPGAAVSGGIKWSVGNVFITLGVFALAGLAGEINAAHCRCDLTAGANVWHGRRRMSAFKSTL